MFHQRPTSHRSLPLAAVHRLPYPLYSHFPLAEVGGHESENTCGRVFWGFYMIEFYRNLPKSGVIWITVHVSFLIGNIPVQNKVQKRPVHFHPSFFWRVQSLILRGDCFLAQKNLFLKQPQVGKVHREKPSIFHDRSMRWHGSRWWFQICFVFTPIWGNEPFWLIFFKWVETTN